MTAEACRSALLSALPAKRAEKLDVAFPSCACEAWSLSEAHPDRINDTELIARVLTAPDGYDETAHTVIASKLQSIYSLGLSVIRQGASDSEILATINSLLCGGKEPRRLVGSILTSAAFLRAYDGCDRWFGIYATDDDQKTHHGEILGTFPKGSNKERKLACSVRRYKLSEGLAGSILFSEEPNELLAQMRREGF